MASLAIPKNLPGNGRIRRGVSRKVSVCKVPGLGFQECLSNKQRAPGV